MANFNQGGIPYDGYPAPGALAVKIPWKGDYVGPANYQQGGYNMNATAFGMSRFEDASFGPLTQSQNYYAKAYYPAASSNSETRAIPPSYMIVKWYFANGTEVANNSNLSAEISYFGAIGI